MQAQKLNLKTIKRYAYNTENPKDCLKLHCFWKLTSNGWSIHQSLTKHSIYQSGLIHKQYENSKRESQFPKPKSMQMPLLQIRMKNIILHLWSKPNVWFTSLGELNNLIVKALNVSLTLLWTLKHFQIAVLLRIEIELGVLCFQIIMRKRCTI